jgi:prophage antirepressor-like protein
VKAHGLKIDRQTLLIPLQDERGNITSLQKIWPNPQIPGKFIKGFLKGSRIQGCSFILGSIADEVAICEGYATGAAIYEITGLPVVIAFSSNNLQYVAGLIAKKHPKTKIIVAADNDRFKPGNPGLTKAKEAAAAVGAKLVVPVFENDDGDPTDFNDLYVREGAEKVRNAFLAKGCNQRCAAKDEKEDNKGGDHTPPLVPLIPPLIPPPSSNEIQVFFYNQKNVRTAQNDGKIQWILKDICDALGLNSPHKVADRLDESEKGRSLIPTPGGVQKLTTVTESGLYRIIHESRKPETRKFERWITHEVLPRIRKHEVCVATESAKTTLSLPKNAQESTENIRKADETKKENDLSPDDEQEITDEHIPDNFRLTDKALYYVDKRLGSIRLCSYLGIANLL